MIDGLGSAEVEIEYCALTASRMILLRFPSGHVINISHYVAPVAIDRLEQSLKEASARTSQPIEIDPRSRRVTRGPYIGLIVSREKAEELEAL